jgi:hypothetical protein
MRGITDNSLGRRDIAVGSNKGETAYGGGALASCLRGRESRVVGARNLSRRMSIWLGPAIFFEKTGQVFGC